MDLNDLKLLISAYADGELSPEHIAEAERILKENEQARQYLEDLRRISMSLRALGDARVSGDMESEILQRLEHKEAVMERQHRWKVSPVLVTFCTVVILTGVSVNTYFHRGIQGRIKSATDQIRDQYATPTPQSRGALSVGTTLQYEPYYSQTSLSINKSYDKGAMAGMATSGESLSMGAVSYNQYEQYAPSNTEEYTTTEESRFLEALQNPLSTFSTDVDTASYANIRRFLTANQMPPKDAVRIEEMINYFGYDYPKPEGNDPFSITTKVANCPWNTGHELVLIGLKGKTPDAEKLPPSNLVFLLDISGSMAQPGKLPLIQQAFIMMAHQLRPQDKVAIVVYAGSEGVALESTSGADQEKIISAIENLLAGGSTAGGAGIRKAYEIAKQNFITDGNNRVILATDGDFNVGVSSTSEMTRLIEEKRKEGVFLTVIGVGTDNIKDGRLMQIADKGNGAYYYLDSIKEARKVFLTELGSTLFTIAKDVKIQVEFNPSVVKAYRLVGYEKRKLNKEDFNDDKKDAGEIGAGHTVTALYEIVPAGSSEAVASVDGLKYQKVQATGAGSNEMMTIKLRYKEPNEDVSKLIVRTLNRSDIKDQVEGDLAFAASVAEFGMLLRSSEFMGKSTVDQVLQLAKGSKGEDRFGYRQEFIDLVQQAQILGVGAASGHMGFK